MIDFFLDFVPRSTTFIAWLVVKGKYMICSLLILSLWLLLTWVEKNVAIVCSDSHLRGAFAMLFNKMKPGLFVQMVGGVRMRALYSSVTPSAVKFNGKISVKSDELKKI